MTVERPLLASAARTIQRLALALGLAATASGCTCGDAASETTDSGASATELTATTVNDLCRFEREAAPDDPRRPEAHRRLEALIAQDRTRLADFLARDNPFSDAVRAQLDRGATTPCAHTFSARVARSIELPPEGDPLLETWSSVAIESLRSPRAGSSIARAFLEQFEAGLLRDAVWLTRATEGDLRLVLRVRVTASSTVPTPEGVIPMLRAHVELDELRGASDEPARSTDLGAVDPAPTAVLELMEGHRPSPTMAVDEHGHEHQAFAGPPTERLLQELGLAVGEHLTNSLYDRPVEEALVAFARQYGSRFSVRGAQRARVCGHDLGVESTTFVLDAEHGTLTGEPLHVTYRATLSGGRLVGTRFDEREELCGRVIERVVLTPRDRQTLEGALDVAFADPGRQCSEPCLGYAAFLTGT